MAITNKIGNRIINTQSGQDAILLIQNNQVQSAIQEKTVGSGSSADAYNRYSVSGVSDWYAGIDNSDNDIFAISSSSIGVNNVFRATPIGNVNLPMQCSFSAYLSSTLTGVVGDNSLYFLPGLTVEYNVGSYYDSSTGIFTAPQDGLYYFAMGVTVTGVTAAMEKFYGAIWENVTGTAAYNGFNAATVKTAGGTAFSFCSNFINLTAGMTVRAYVALDGAASNTANIVAGNSTTYFSGGLVA